MKKTLLNETNLSTCELYYCESCKEFGRKISTDMMMANGGRGDENSSIEKPDELLANNRVVDLVCPKCGRQLVRSGKIIDAMKTSSGGPGVGLTLKEVLSSLKQTSAPIPSGLATLQPPPFDSATVNTSILSSSSNKNSDTNSVMSSEVEDESNTNHPDVKEVFLLVSILKMELN